MAFFCLLDHVDGFLVLLTVSMWRKRRKLRENFWMEWNEGSKNLANLNFCNGFLSAIFRWIDETCVLRVAYSPVFNGYFENRHLSVEDFSGCKFSGIIPEKPKITHKNPIYSKKSINLFGPSMAATLISTDIVQSHFLFSTASLSLEKNGFAMAAFWTSVLLCSRECGVGDDIGNDVG